MALIDTDILIDVTRENGPPQAVEWLNALGPLPGVPQVVALELLRGARSRSDMEYLKEFLGEFERIEYHTHEDQKTAQKIIEEYKLAHGIGVGDALIAATALRLDETLFSLNRKHFEPIKGLKLEVPYEKD